MGYLQQTRGLVESCDQLATGIHPMESDSHFIGITCFVKYCRRVLFESTLSHSIVDDGGGACTMGGIR